MAERLHVYKRGVIKKFVDCLYEIKTSQSTLMNFGTFLKHLIFRLYMYNKLGYTLIIFK